MIEVFERTEHESAKNYVLRVLIDNIVNTRHLREILEAEVSRIACRKLLTVCGKM